MTRRWSEAELKKMKTKKSNKNWFTYYEKSHLAIPLLIPTLKYLYLKLLIFIHNYTIPKITVLIETKQPREHLYTNINKATCIFIQLRFWDINDKKCLEGWNWAFINFNIFSVVVRTWMLCALASLSLHKKRGICVWK